VSAAANLRAFVRTDFLIRTDTNPSLFMMAIYHTFRCVAAVIHTVGLQHCCTSLSIYIEDRGGTATSRLRFLNALSLAGSIARLLYRVLWSILLANRHQCMKFKTIDGTTYYKPTTEKRRTPILGLVALVIAFSLVAGYLADTFGYQALG